MTPADATAPAATAAEAASVEPDRSDAARRRVVVAITIVLTVWGTIFLSIFSFYVAGEPTKLPAPVTGPGALPPIPPGPAGPHVPLIPPRGEEPGHEGHGHAPGEHGKDQ
ncbi:MAG: hypothetical protein ACYTGX_12860 [Planctomycetota bacterium]|jgi:hypothetical protein